MDETEAVGGAARARVRPLRATPGRTVDRERRRRRVVGVAAVVVALLGTIVAVGDGVDGDELQTAGAGRSALEARPPTSTEAPTGAWAVGSEAQGDPATGVPPVGAEPTTSTPGGAPDTTAAAGAAPPPAVGPPATSATTAPRTSSTLPGAESPPPSGGSHRTASVSRAPVAGRIIVPRLGLDTTLYEGGEMAQIDQGPSYLPYTRRPGRQGNTVVAGHRTTKTRPFYDLDKLQVGDTVTFVVPSGTYTYSFTHHEVVREDGVHILRSGPGYEATLFACHPKGSSSHRLVAHFTLQSEPDPTPAPTSPTSTTRPSPSTTLRLPGR